MSYAAGSLADGQLATSEADIYLVPASTTAYINQVLLLNTNATVQTVDVYIKRSGQTSRHVRRLELAQYESADVFAGSRALNLSSGDAIRALTTTATAVNYSIHGVLQT